MTWTLKILFILWKKKNLHIILIAYVQPLRWHNNDNDMAYKASCWTKHSPLTCTSAACAGGWYCTPHIENTSTSGTKTKKNVSVNGFLQSNTELYSIYTVDKIKRYNYNLLSLIPSLGTRGFTLDNLARHVSLVVEATKLIWSHRRPDYTEQY